MSGSAPNRVLLSAASGEFRSHRLRLANQLGALRGAPWEVKVQEDFQQGGHTLLEGLADYIRGCDLVIHFAGDACGARPTPEHERALLAHLGEPSTTPAPGRSYTQWEYDLARRFNKRLFVYMPQQGAPRDCALPVLQSDDERLLQAAHLRRITDSGQHYRLFADVHQLVRDVVHDLGLEERKVSNIPFRSLGSLFKGRDEFLRQVREALGTITHRGHQRFAAITASASAVAVHGLGGIGKTRAAIEYAHRYAEEYTALLFVGADSPTSLHDNLAHLCGAMLLDLKEQDARESQVRIDAVLRWLQLHPGWLLIFDSVDTEEAAREIESLLRRLHGTGQVLVTSRLRNWSGGVQTLALDVLGVEDASAFLLERTASRRRASPDDPAQARLLALDLGQLALALEQAGAYIAQRRLTLADYREEWRSSHDKVIEWFDERLMQYPKSVAVTWQTSFDQLSPAARDLLNRLAWLAPDPISESLLAVPVPDAPAAAGEAIDALVNLDEFSLVSRSPSATTFSVHRLVQDVSRRRGDDATHRVLRTALGWLRLAFVGDPEDVRSWPTLDPLAAHALSVANFADAVGVRDGTSYLLSQCGVLSHSKANWAEAEPLMRRALAIDEASYGKDHPNVAIRLNNLTQLLKATNRLADAEPLTVSSRTRPPHARIEYAPPTRDVKHFTIGVLGNLLGQTVPRQSQKDRILTKISAETFEECMKALCPSLSLSVDNKMSDAGGSLPVNLTFTGMSDFTPEGLVRQIEPLRKLMELREKLGSLDTKLSGIDSSKLADFLNDPKILSALAGTTGDAKTDTHHASQQSDSPDRSNVQQGEPGIQKPQTGAVTPEDEGRKTTEGAPDLRALLQISFRPRTAAKEEVEAGRASTVGETASVEALKQIGATINARVSAQISEIQNNSNFQQVESDWRNLHSLCQSAPAAEVVLAADPAQPGVFEAHLVASPGPGSTEWPVAIRPSVGGGEVTDLPVLAFPSETATSSMCEDLQFTLYRPRTIVPDRWYQLLAFAHRSDEPPPGSGRASPVQLVQQQASQILGARSSSYRATSQDSHRDVAWGTMLRFVPEVEGLEFNPRERQFDLREDVHCEHFRVRAPASLGGKTVHGRMAVYVGVVSIADVPLAIPVTGDDSGDEYTTESSSAKAFRRIFVSYSRRDLSIVQLVADANRALGDEVLRDLTHIESGADWAQTVRSLINESDVFQLFWSRNSMRSRQVEMEWRHALSLNRCGFIRPVYWEDPLPQDRAAGLPPEELQRLHFFRLLPPASAPLASQDVLVPSATPPLLARQVERRRPWVMLTTIIAIIVLVFLLMRSLHS